MGHEKCYSLKKFNRLKKQKQKKKCNTWSLRDEIKLLSSKLKTKTYQELDILYNVNLSRLMKESPAKFSGFISPRTSHADTFVITNRLTSDETGISDAFTDHFKSVFTCHNSCTPRFAELEILLAIDDVEIIEPGVFNVLLNLDESKFPGPDEISNAFLKRYAD